MTVQPKHLDQADRIRQAHDDRNLSIRSRAELTPEAKTALLAKNYLAAKESMAALQQTAGADTSEQRTKAERSAFGTNGLPGDPATVAVSYRDAMDRAATLTSSADATALLARADRAGDEPLARAVAGHAHDASTSPLGRLDPGWSDVVDTYTATRYAAGRAVDTLRALQPGATNSTRSMFAFVLPKPSELGSTPDYQMGALAASAP